MKFSKACIPIGFSWSSPFVRWQGDLADVPSTDLAVTVTKRALKDRHFDPQDVSQIVLGWTIPQKHIFYGAPTVAAKIGAPHTTGPMISQACATSVACVQAAALSAEGGETGNVLVVTTDRTSNGPHIVYPRPSAIGGSPDSENYVVDSFNKDPWAGKSMVETAENVATMAGITREELDDVTLLRYEQYQTALANDRDFQKAYMVPIDLPKSTISEDVGVYPTKREKLAKLSPVIPGGVVTYAAQTHPADGTAGSIITNEANARRLSKDRGIVRILSTGMARVGKAEMPKAPVPASEVALQNAGLTIEDIDAVTTHNPFAVNDIWFSREMGVPLEQFNIYGSSLIYGHPQAPTGLRLITELIETLYRRGGGIGLFTGCAAGDTGAAIVIRVED